MMVSASPLFVYPCEKQTVICQCLFITREGHVILSGLGWQLLGRSRQYRQGRALSHTDRIAEPDTEAVFHVCVWTHACTFLHLLSLKCNNADGILETAVTRETRAERTTNMHGCVSWAVKCRWGNDRL